MENEKDFINDIVSPQDLIPEPMDMYIDLDNNVFVVEILTSKHMYEKLSKESNFKDLLNKPFGEFHENVLYGMYSCQCSGMDEMKILRDKEFKTVVGKDVANKLNMNSGIFGISVFNLFNIDLTGDANIEHSKLIHKKDESNFIIKIAYEFETIELDIINHVLDEALYKLDQGEQNGK